MTASLMTTSLLAQDTVGAFGCTASICVLSNAYMRFGTGSENSVNAWGLFQQPWYYSPSVSAWYKLTFSNYPLDTAIGTGTSGPNWSGATVTDLYALTNTGATTDYSAFVVSSSSTSVTVGHGVITSSRQYTVLGQQIWFQNSFSLGANDSFVQVTTRVINNSTSTINNIILWIGTRDDFVGSTDVNTKTRGNINASGFFPVTANSQASRAIMITNPTDGILFYSETAGVMTSYSACCSFSNVYNTYPLSLAPSTPTPTDGSYAAVLPIGNLTAGSSASIIWYYAAGVINSLTTSVVQSVAVAQVAVAQSTELYNSSTATSSSTGTSSSTAINTRSATSSGTATSSQTATSTATGTSSQTATSTATGTSSQTATTSATPTAAQTPTPVGTTIAPVPTLSPLQSILTTGTSANSPSPSSTGSGTATASVSRTARPSPSVSLSASNSRSPSGTATPRSSRSNTLSNSYSKSSSITAYSTRAPSATYCRSTVPTSTIVNTPSPTSTALATYTGIASDSATSTPSPTPTPSTTSTLAIKVLIAEMPAFNITSSTSTSTTIVQVNNTDSALYVLISFIIIGAAGWTAWKIWKKWKKGKARATEADEAVIAAATAATAISKKKSVQIRLPET